MKRSILCSVAMALALVAVTVTVTVLAQPGASRVSASEDPARVRFIHASPDAPELDLLLNDTELVTNTAFGEISDYIAVDLGAYTTTLRDANTGALLLAGYPITVFSAHPPRTFAAAGMVAPGAGASGFEGIIITDVIVPPPPEMVRGRFVHLVPDAPVPVSIVLEDEILFEDIVYGDVTPYVTVPAGTHNLEVRALGFRVAADTITVDPDSVYSFFAIGLATGQPEAEILQVVDASFPHRIWLPLLARGG